MSFCTSFSVNLRPIRRLTAYSVFLGLVTAWRLAEAPTRISPSSWEATIEGVVRAPSLFSITRVVLPSMMDTQLLVVPRSMPMILPMVFAPNAEMVGLAGNLWIRPGGSSFGGRNGAQRRAQHALGNHIAFLQHGHDGIGFLLGRHHADGLVLMGV